MTGEVIRVDFTPGRVDGQLALWLVRGGGPELVLLLPEAVTVDGMRADGPAAVAALYAGRCRVTLARFCPELAAYSEAAFERLGR